MTQGTEAQYAAPRRQSASAPPGLGLATAIAVIVGTLGGWWLASGRSQPPEPDEPDVSALQEVVEPEVMDALGTMNLSDAAIAQFREGKPRGCRRPLAWVAVASLPGASPSRIRLISGNYYSPVFEVTATPVRVALPFPAPYETGHGTLTAIEVGGSASVSLLPAWRVAAQDGKLTRTVRWHPLQKCQSRDAS